MLDKIRKEHDKSKWKDRGIGFGVGSVLALIVLIILL